MPFEILKSQLQKGKMVVGNDVDPYLEGLINTPDIEDGKTVHLSAEDVRSFYNAKGEDGLSLLQQLQIEVGKRSKISLFSPQAIAYMEGIKSQLEFVKIFRQDWSLGDVSDADIKSRFKTLFALDLDQPSDFKTATTLIRLGFRFDLRLDLESNSIPSLSVPLVEDAYFSAQYNESITPLPTFTALSCKEKSNGIYEVRLETSQGEIQTYTIDTNAQLGNSTYQDPSGKIETKEKLTYADYWYWSTMGKQYKLLTTIVKGNLTLSSTGQTAGQTLSVVFSNEDKTYTTSAVIPDGNDGRVLTRPPRLLGGKILELRYKRTNAQTKVKESIVLWLTPHVGQNGETVEIQWYEDLYMDRGTHTQLIDSGGWNLNLQQEINSVLGVKNH